MKTWGRLLVVAKASPVVVKAERVVQRCSLVAEESYRLELTTVIIIHEFQNGRWTKIQRKPDR